ncbi:MAG: GIY-YIG nuclease family protein [Sphingobacteriaceae bacterium]|nr:GIY-YIG nuclease family protein [Sphingobacteriaceae bacterium]
MKVFKFQPPYKPNGRTNFPEMQKRSGVYLIKENGKLTYVGYSGTDLYKTVYRHFQYWSPREYKNGRAIPAQYRVTYKNKLKTHSYTVRIIYCTPGQAQRLEKLLIKKHKPRDNDFKYDSYELDFNDNRTYQIYQDTIPLSEVPF